MGTTVSYSYDQTGRLVTVSGTGYGNVTQFASNFQYRAWGAIKDFDYGNGVHQHIGFNNRLQLTSSTFSNVYLGSNPNATIAKSYDYYADGHNWHAYNGADNRFDRAYTYDHAARLLDALSGSEARGGTAADGPYKQHYGYDALGNVTGRAGRVWSWDNSDSASFTNNRRQYWGYDAEGHATQPAGGAYAYDVGARPASYVAAAGWVGGGQTGNPSQPGLEAVTAFDGSGAPAKQVQTTRTEALIGDGPQTQISTDVSTTYYLRSTALGGKIVAELNTTGAHVINHVYAGSMEAAQNSVGPGYSWVTWLHTDPVTGSSFATDTSRAFSNQKEIDPLGTDVTTPLPPGSVSSCNPLSVFCGLGIGLIEAEHDWSDPITGKSEADEGMAQYVAWMNVAIADARMTDADKVAAQAAYEAYKAATDPTEKAKYKKIFDGILAGNPNVGIIVTQHGKTRTIWGKAAADFLDGLGSANVTVVGGHPQDPAQPQNSQKTRGRKETKECANIRTILFGNFIIKRTLDNTWDRSLEKKEEQGGLLGEVIDDGPYSGNWVSQPFYRLGGPSFKLQGMTDWELKKIAEDKETILYRFSYHTHPFREGERTPEGVTVGDPNQPSGADGDLYTAGKDGLLGIVISKEQFVVYNKDGVLCRFQR